MCVPSCCNRENRDTVSEMILHYIKILKCLRKRKYSRLMPRQLPTEEKSKKNTWHSLLIRTEFYVHINRPKIRRLIYNVHIYMMNDIKSRDEWKKKSRISNERHHAEPVAVRIRRRKQPRRTMVYEAPSG